jgi:single-strand DNA-binding protein
MSNLNEIKNIAVICGTLAGRPSLSHRSRNEEYYTFPIETGRLSGVTDVLNVIARRSLLDSLEPDRSPRVLVSGEVRSFNNKGGGGSKLVISVFAREVSLTDDPDSNFVALHGVLCKAPTFRHTPMGRDICDLMLAVNRYYGRSDYLPCIVWGQTARDASQWQVGTALQIEGRLQSRKYIKSRDDGVSVERTAFEVSAGTANVLA